MSKTTQEIDMDKCRVSQDELLHDIKQFRSNMAEQYSEREQRLEAIALAKLYLHGQAAIKDEDGRDYPMTELMVAVWDHKLYEATFKALAMGVHHPMQDLIIGRARYACAVHLFGESRADELGFVK